MTGKGRLRRRAAAPPAPRAASLVMLIVSVVTCRTAVAQSTDPDSAASRPEARDGWGPSYWGTIPAPADSVSGPDTPLGTPAWETVLLVPYYAVAVPLRVVADAVGVTVQWLDERRVIQRVAELLGPREGPFGTTLQFSAGGLTGFGAGVAAQHDDVLGSGVRLKLRADASTTGHRRATLGVEVPRGRTGTIQFGAGYRQRPNARYFGLGPDTEAARESYYEHEIGWGGISYERSVVGGLTVGSQVLLSTVGTGPPRVQNTPALAAEFAGALPRGYGTTSTGIAVGVSLTHTSVDDDGRPSRGGVRRARIAQFRATDGAGTRFWTYRGEVQQFVRLWFPATVLALRGYVTWVDPVGTREVPFQRLITNDDPDLLRGFRDFRWRARGMTVLSAEYRWPLWALTHADRLGADLYVLADVGQVFDTFDQISSDRMTFSYGGGIRLLNSQGFILRLEYARSGEEGVLRLRSDQLFQFAKGDLFHGRDPVPSR